MIVTVKGKVFSGHGDGRRFIELTWVRKQIKRKLSFEPYPGTLNLILPLDPNTTGLLNKFKGIEIVPEKGYFPGRLYEALINGRVNGAVVRPEVPGYPDQLLDVVAPMFLREEFDLKDGDEVEVKIRLE